MGLGGRIDLTNFWVKFCTIGAFQVQWQTVFVLKLGKIMADFLVLDGKSIVFIGGGNMAGAMIGGLINARDSHELNLTIGVSDKHTDKLAHFAKQGIQTTMPDTAHTLIEKADVVVLAIKPQILAEVAPSLAPYLADKLVLSVLAGVSIDVLSGALGTAHVVRAMPNLPASIGAGATGLYASANIDKGACAVCEAIMSSCGVAVWVADEDKLHAVTAVSGSAPAYFFYVLEHMTAEAVAMGLPVDVAHKLAVQSMIGAGMLAKTGNPTTLREAVTSKGGTTAEAINSLNHDDVGGAFGRAMRACYERSIELGKL